MAIVDTTKARTAMSRNLVRALNRDYLGAYVDIVRACHYHGS